MPAVSCHDYEKNQHARVSDQTFSSERVISVWNDTPTDTVGFTSTTNVKKSIMCVDITAHRKCLLEHFVYLSI